LTCTRPDILFGVGLIYKQVYGDTENLTFEGRKQRGFSQLHKGKRVDHGFFYSRNCNLELVGFSDSDWAGSHEDRKSTTGFVFDLGAAFTWSSKKQSIVALSTSEAEYIAASIRLSLSCYTIWLRRRFLEKMELKQEEASKIYIDNKSAIALAKNRTRFIMRKGSSILTLSFTE